MANAPAVGGPGALSRRTDKGPAQKLRDLPDAQYGENATYRDLQQGAPLAQTPAMSQANVTGNDTGPGAGLSQVPGGLDAATQRPDEPVTAGAPSGPGPNILNLPDNGASGYQDARSLLSRLASSNPDNSEVQFLLGQISRGGM